MSKKSLLTESEIARFKQLAGIPLKASEAKVLSEAKYGKEEKEMKGKKETEELDEDLSALFEAEDEEEMGGEEEAPEAPEMGGDEELDLGDMGDESAPEAPEMGGDEGMDDMEGGESAEQLIVNIVSMLQKLGKKVGVDIETDGDLMGGDHAEPDEDNMGGPSDMDADNMDDEEMDMDMSDEGGEDEDEEEEGEEEEEETEEEELEERAQMPFDQDRREDERAPKLNESAIRAISERVAARLQGVSNTNKKAIIEAVTKRIAARLIAEAKGKKKSIKEKMTAKKGGKAGHGPGNKVYGVKGKVANEYSLKDVKLPKNTGGKDTVVAKGGAKTKTIPNVAKKGSGKATKKNTTN